MIIGEKVSGIKNSSFTDNIKSQLSFSSSRSKMLKGSKEFMRAFFNILWRYRMLSVREEEMGAHYRVRLKHAWPGVFLIWDLQSSIGNKTSKHQPHHQPMTYESLLERWRLSLTVHQSRNIQCYAWTVNDNRLSAISKKITKSVLYRPYDSRHRTCY